MKALVIGANGFLGRNLVKKLLSLGWEVDCIYHKFKNFIPKRCKCIQIDNLESLKDNYEVVFLLAAYIPYGNFSKPDKRFIDVNVKIPQRVVNKFSISKIIFASTVSVYAINKSVIYENSKINKEDLYGLSKLKAESILRFQKNYQIIRFSSMYGKGMNKVTFIPKIIRAAKKNKKITIHGNGSRLQNYLYVDDAVDYLYVASKRHKSGIYLGVYDKSYSNNEVAKIVQKFIPGCKIDYVGDDNSPSFVYNNSLTKKMLKFSPKIPLEEGIRKIIKHE